MKEREERIRRLETEMELLIDKSKGLNREMQKEITEQLIIKSYEYYQLTGDYYKTRQSKNMDLW